VAGHGISAQRRTFSDEFLNTQKPATENGGKRSALRIRRQDCPAISAGRAAG
jgi:hypothetical protein